MTGWAPDFAPFQSSGQANLNRGMQSGERPLWQSHSTNQPARHRSSQESPHAGAAAAFSR
jgi:hypothetical protein